MSDYFVEDGSFFRIQNVAMAYTFRNIRLGDYMLPSVKLSMTADRPLTCFKSNGFTPEITDINGWDTQVYPLAATYSFSVAIDF